MDSYSSTINIDDNIFYGRKGVTLNGTALATITNNHFTVISGPAPPFFGLTTFDSYGFEIEQNTFSTSTFNGTVTTDDRHFGLFIHNSDGPPVGSGFFAAFPSLIRENIFNNENEDGDDVPFRAATVIQGEHIDLDFACNYYNYEHLTDWLFLDNDGATDFEIIDLASCVSGDPLVQQWNVVGDFPITDRFHIENQSINAFADIDWQQVQPISFNNPIMVSANPTECIPGPGVPLIGCNVALVTDLDPILMASACEEILALDKKDLERKIRYLHQNREVEQFRMILDCINQPWSNGLLSAAHLSERDGEQALFYANKLPESNTEEADFKAFYVSRAQAQIGGSGKRAMLEKVMGELENKPSNFPIRTLAESYRALKTGKTFPRSLNLPKSKNKSQSSILKYPTLHFSPNPANQQIVLSLDLQWSDSNDLNLSIVNAQGKLVYLERIDDYNPQISTSELEEGLYILTLRDENNQILGLNKLLIIH